MELSLSERQINADLLMRFKTEIDRIAGLKTDEEEHPQTLSNSECRYLHKLLGICPEILIENNGQVLISILYKLDLAIKPRACVVKFTFVELLFLVLLLESSQPNEQSNA